MIKLGQKVRDSITGFEGLVTGTVQYLTGCNQALVSPRAKEDGALPDSRWFDDDRLEVTDKSIFALPRRSAPGADIPAPVR